MPAPKFAPMTRAEAKRLLIGAYPHRTVFIGIQESHYGDLSHATMDEIQYRVSILPGIKGDTCSQWVADTMSGAVRQALEAGLQDPPTEAEINGYFARPSDAVELEALKSPDEQDTAEFPALMRATPAEAREFVSRAMDS